MEVTNEKKCENCKYFTSYDSEKGICSVPLWVKSKLYQMHYTKMGDVCHMHESK